MYDRDSQTLRRDEEQLRQSAVVKAERWTAGQATRLGMTPEVILEAVRPVAPGTDRGRIEQVCAGGSPAAAGGRAGMDRHSGRKAGQG